jgi:8-oxo-dGTP pyrophosphatase MutT (NUDIX family)
MKRRIALIFAFRDGMLLLGKRNDNGKWTLPGGHLEDGEDPKEGAIRELFEETGLKPKGELKLIDERTIGTADFYTYECEVEGSPTGKNDPDEECLLWVWVDVSNGIPKAVAENMSGPRDPEKNVAKDMLGLDKSLTKREEDDEVDRLLLHPNPAERKMALKLANVGERHLVRAFADEDPEVQRLALKHPQVGYAALMGLMRMPDRGHLAILALEHPAIQRAHLEALYHAHKNKPIHEKKDILHAISHHGALDESLIERMVEDGHGNGVIDNLKTPVHVLQKVIEQHFLDPQDPQKRSLARRALKHPSTPLNLVHRALKEAPMDVRLAVASRPGLDSGIVQDILVRGRLPTYDHEAFLRAALVQNPEATKQHLETAAKDRNSLVRAYAKAAQRQTNKFERDLGECFGKLVKSMKSEDFASIVRATDYAGSGLVDHKPDLEAHPPEHAHDVQAYRQHVIDSPEVVRRERGGGVSGITKKVLYQLPNHHPTHPNVRFMVKPYNERVISRVTKWGKYPYQGWAEMTNQALYHAGGIGHLHQNVHVAEHNMGPGYEAEPALVVKIEPGWNTAEEASFLYDRPTEGLEHDARRVALMDFLTNNLDRHSQNLLVRSEADPSLASNLLAIDHSRSFQYNNTYEHKWKARRHQPKEIKDRIGLYIDGHSKPGIATIIIKSYYDHAKQVAEVNAWNSAFDWWAEASPKIRATMEKRLEQIRDPEIRDHIRRNFNERAKHLDDIARWGVDNFGTDWYNIPVRLYRPGEKPST